jgi:hypothetical protein
MLLLQFGILPRKKIPSYLRRAVVIAESAVFAKGSEDLWIQIQTNISGIRITAQLTKKTHNYLALESNVCHCLMSNPQIVLNSAGPLNILEEEIDNWISGQADRIPPAGGLASHQDRADRGISSQAS